LHKTTIAINILVEYNTRITDEFCRRYRLVTIKYRSKLTITNIHEAKCASADEKNVKIRQTDNDVLNIGVS